MATPPKSIRIPTTALQKNQLGPLLNTLTDGDVLFAQAFPDGFVVAKVDADKAKEIANVLAGGFCVDAFSDRCFAPRSKPTRKTASLRDFSDTEPSTI